MEPKELHGVGIADNTAGEVVPVKKEVRTSTSQDEMSVEIPEPAKPRPERQPGFADYLRIFSYAEKWDFLLLLVAALASIGAGVTMPMMNVIFGKLVGNFSSFGQNGSTFNVDDFKDLLDHQALLLFVLFLARFALCYLNKFTFRMIGIRMSAAIRMDYLRCLFAQTVHVLDSMPTGAAAGTITGTANTLQLGISEKLANWLEYSTQSIASIIIAMIYSWELTLVTSSLIVFVFVVVGTFLPFLVMGQQRQIKAETRATSVASEAFASIKMIQACSAESRVLERFQHWVDQAHGHVRRIEPMVSSEIGLVFFAIFGSFGLAFWYGSRMYVKGELDSVGTVVIVLMNVMLIIMSLERTATPLVAVSKAMVAAAEFFAVIDAPKPAQGTLRAPEVQSGEDIVFTAVDFAYPARPHIKILDDLNLRIEAGKVNAIVGPSGSGKSTIVGLVEKWYTLKDDQYIIAKTVEKPKNESKKHKNKNQSKDVGGDDEDDDENPPTHEDMGPPIKLKGSIATAGHELDDINAAWWRSQIGLVQQEPFLFNDTIHNNVAYGLIGSEFEKVSDEEKRKLVVEACKEAFADEFIARMPDGYDTLVGDSGQKMSGGQRQRISIARAIIKRPKILILDEATSAIDVRSEKIVTEALERASRHRGRTTITIAHRLSTIKTAHRINVLQKGRCVEHGTHESLLANENGVYHSLVLAQQLSLGGETEDENDLVEESIENVLSREKSAALSQAASTRKADKWKTRGLIDGFGKLLGEQRGLWPLALVMFLGAVAAAVSGPGQAYLFAQVITVFNYNGQKLLDDSQHWTYAWVILACIVGSGYFFVIYSSLHAGNRISARYRSEYFESIIMQKTSYFDEEANSSGSLTGRISGDPKQLEELLGLSMAMFTSSFLSLIGCLIISFVYGWKLALVALCVTVPLGTLAGYYRYRYELQFEKMYAEVFQESSRWASESIGAFRTVQSLTLEPVICDRYDSLLRGHVTKALRSAWLKTLVLALSDSINLGCQSLIFWYGGNLVANGEYSLTEFFVCYMAAIQGAEAAGQGFSFGPNAAQSSAAANRILHTRSTRNRDNVSREAKIPETEGGIKIEFENVHFKYATRNVHIFRGLNLTIERGQYAALVGASGSGKTSIVSLLERFYDPQRGSIRLNGMDINEVNIYEYRKNISLVAQESALLQGTIRENILLGVDPSTVTEEQVQQVCRDAGLAELIASLPDGLNTDVGNKGVSLSGGQKQRISIARGLIRDPRLLLLDEATSSLDSETEKQIQQTFEHVAKGRTTVAVAHRLSTIQNADVIFVLGEGKVLEKGSHAELLKNHGPYYHMCRSQALDR